MLGNAVFDAVGARVRLFPLTPERVREAMATCGRSAGTRVAWRVRIEAG